MHAQQLIGTRKIRKQDLGLILRWRNHPDVRGCMLSQHEISMAEHSSWFDRSAKDKTRALFIIEEAGRAIGCVIFSNVGIGSTADWSFYADPDSAPGTGRKVCASALEVAFNELKVHKVVGRVLDFNQASIRLHLRLGFRQEGVLREHLLISDKYHDLLIYGMLSDEWSCHKSAMN